MEEGYYLLFIPKKPSERDLAFPPKGFPEKHRALPASCISYARRVRRVRVPLRGDAPPVDVYLTCQGLAGERDDWPEAVIASVDWLLATLLTLKKVCSRLRKHFNLEILRFFFMIIWHLVEQVTQAHDTPHICGTDLKCVTMVRRRRVSGRCERLDRENILWAFPLLTESSLAGQRGEALF